MADKPQGVGLNQKVDLQSLCSYYNVRVHTQIEFGPWAPPSPSLGP